MSAQHTPGPWELIHFGGPQIGHKATGEAVCTMWGDENDPADQFHANARLIAAAPELYDALIFASPIVREAQEALCGQGDVCADHDGNDLLHLLRDKIDAALAKARGEA